MNFRIIDGNDNHFNHYEEFKEDFTNPNITVKELTRKYDLSRKQYSNLRTKVLDETGLESKPYKTMKDQSTSIIHEDTYIRKCKDYYFIQKKIDGKRKSFGAFEDITTARKVRDKLVEADWDTDVAEELQAEYSRKRKTLIDKALNQYFEFSKLYNQGTRKEKIKQTLNFTDYQYNKLLQILKKEKGM